MTANDFPTIQIVYEDDDTVVINKPAGVVVNKSQTHKGFTIQEWMEKKFQISNYKFQKKSEGGGESVILGDPEQIFKERSGIVHRLDKETSGVMLLAKHPDALIFYMSQFKLRQTEKKYVALVHGKMQPERGVIDLPIARNSKDRLQFAVREDGRESVTEYQVLEFYPHLDVERFFTARNEERKAAGQTKEEARLLAMEEKKRGLNLRKSSKKYQGFSLVELTPKTGRTHQIRVHLSHLHHPIVGDKVYSGSKRKAMDQIWCHRHFLHAKSLKLSKYRTNSEVIFEAPLSEDLAKSLSFMETV